MAVLLMDAVHPDKQTEEDNASECGPASPEPEVNVAIEALATPTNENHESIPDPFPQSRKVRKKPKMAAHFENDGFN